MSNKTIIITGPTAAGKTDISIKIAKELGGEIISADSMQIYRGLNIGTAKITAEEARGIRHHLIDIADIGEAYTVADFQSAAKNAAADILSRGKQPIIAGGTGLYINSLIYDLDFTNTTANPELRARLEELSNEELYAELTKTDSIAAQRIHINDRKRLIRRLEVLSCGGAEEYDFRRKNADFDYVLIGITMDRERLYERINARVDVMLESGLVQEARALYEKYGEKLAALRAIGYSELIEYFRGNCTLLEAAESIKRSTRRFAKRQMTWFNREEELRWFNRSEMSDGELFGAVMEYIKIKERE